jgi:hypothetical protein
MVVSVLFQYSFFRKSTELPLLPQHYFFLGGASTAAAAAVPIARALMNARVTITTLSPSAAAGGGLPFLRMQVILRNNAASQHPRK